MSFRRASSRAAFSLALLLLVAPLAACGGSADPFTSVTALTPERKVVPLEVLPSRVMVALVFGQSNSANSGTPPANGGPGVYNFHAGGLYEAQDPLLGATGGGGSVWTRLGPKLLGSGYDAVVFAPVGVGGSAVARWAVGGDLHPRLLGAVADLKRAGLTPTHLLWHQGEADNALGTSKDAYRARFLAMLGGLRAEGVDAPVYVSVATRCGGRGPSVPLREAQQELVSEALNIRPGPDTDALGADYRPDGCHFGAEGLERYADLWLGALAPAPRKIPQTLRFDLPGGRKTAADPAFSVAPYAAATSGLAALFTAPDPAVCSVTEAGTVTLSGAGTCTLTAGQPGDAVYAPAPPLTRSFTVVAPDPVAVVAETYRVDLERAPVGTLYTVRLGGGVTGSASGAATTGPLSTGPVIVVGKRRYSGVILQAQVAKALPLYGSRRLTVALPGTDTPAPQGGRLKLDFSKFAPGGVTLGALTVSNLTASGAALTLFYADGTSARQPLGTTAPGGSLRVALAATGLRALDIFAPTAFAVDDVAFTVDR